MSHGTILSSVSICPFRRPSPGLVVIVQRLVCIHVFLLLPSGAFSQGTDYWQQVSGLYGGQAFSLVFDSNGSLLATGNNFYYTELGAHILRSTDDGQTWVRIGSSVRFATLLQKTSDGNILAAANGRLYRSTDQALSWDTVGIGLPPSYLRSIVTTPWGSLFAAASGSGVFESTNDGVDWTARNTGLLGAGVFSVLAKKGGRMWVGSDSGVFKSVDSGRAWTRPLNVLSGRMVWGLAADSNGALYAASRPGVYRSTDEGISWMRTNPSSSIPYGRELVVHPSGLILAGTVGGLWTSVDSGVTWRSVYLGAPSFSYPDIFKILVHHDGGVYIGTSYGVYESTTGEDPWKKIGIPNSVVNSVAIHPGGALFAGTTDGFLRSTDKGKSWIWDTLTLWDRITTIVIDRFGSVYTAGSYLARSTDTGKTRQRIDSGILSPLTGAFAVSPNGTLFAGTTSIISDPPDSCCGGVYRSTDSGVSWSLVTDREDIRDLAVNSLGHVFAATLGSTILRSTDNGNSWSQSAWVGQVLTITIDPRDRLWAGMLGSGLSLSTDEGQSWTQSGLSAAPVLKVTFNGNNHIFAGTDSGVYRSTDDGATWARLRGSRPDCQVDAMAVDSLGFLYVGTPGAGLFRSVQTTLGVAGNSVRGVPSSFVLSQNFPNPFNPSTIISYSIPRKSHVILRVYNLLGQELAVLEDAEKSPGNYAASWNADAYPSGVYYCRMMAGQFTGTRKLLLLR